MKTKTLVSLSHWELALSTEDAAIITLALMDSLIVYDNLRNYYLPIQESDGTWFLQYSDDPAHS